MNFNPCSEGYIYPTLLFDIDLNNINPLNDANLKIYTYDIIVLKLIMYSIYDIDQHVHNKAFHCVSIQISYTSDEVLINIVDADASA